MGAGMEQRFLEQIVANIEDDLPRLVYADWLMEQGQDERSEFIHVQVARARLPVWDPSQVKLRLREKELLRDHGERWLAELPKVEGARWEGFRRGIVAEVTFDSYEAMRSHAHTCRQLAPLEAVNVPWPRRKDSKTKVNPIAELRELELSGRPYDEEVALLADSPQLATLRKLDVLGLDANDLGLLAASPHLAGLRSLRLDSNGIGTAGVQALVASSALASLEQLDLSGPGYYDQYYDDPLINEAGMVALAAWAGLAKVHTLTLSGSDVRPAGLRRLLSSQNAISLKRLSLRGGRLEGTAAAEFAAARAEIQLDVLNLGENVFGDEMASSLASAPCLTGLKALGLDRCEITAAGARQLADAAFLGELRCLDLGYNSIGPAGLEALMERAPANLHTLRIRDNDLGDAGVKWLAKSPASDTLLDLDLRDNAITGAGAKALEATTYLKELALLRLAGNSLGTEAAEHLAASAFGKRLTVLETEASTNWRRQNRSTDDFTFDGDGQRWIFDEN